MKKSVLFVLVILICISVGTALAAPINMTEGTDFPNTNSSTTNLGSFDTGLNIISGSVARNGDNGGDYGDFWDALLLPGMQISGIEFDLTITTDNGDAGYVHAMVSDGMISNPTSTTKADQWFGTDGTYSLSGAYPFGAGQYYFGAIASFDSTYTYDYEWRVTVDSVPLPSTISLLGFGILGLAGISRRKR